MSPGPNGAATAPTDRRRPARTFAWAAAVLLLGLLLGFVWWLQPQNADRSQREAAGNAATPGIGVDAPGLAALTTRSQGAAADETNRWPVSLAGSLPDGEPEQDSGGRLRPSRGLRRLFDYFLTAQGERELPAIRQLLQDYLDERYPATLVAEVMREFDRYLDYQAALASLPPETDLIARLDALVGLRRRWFDAATAEAFFGEEERMTRTTLARLAIARDPDLDAGERRARLDALAENLPAEQTALAAEAETALRIAAQTEQLDARGADAATRRSERAALFGEEAAERLARLDQDRAHWDARLAAYTQARDAIRADPALSPAEIAAHLAALRASRFDASEQRRIASLEAIGQL
ncbi:MAG: lipase secretion chaperone [Lysobacterales bacterium]